MAVESLGEDGAEPLFLHGFGGEEDRGPCDVFGWAEEAIVCDAIIRLLCEGPGKADLTVTVFGLEGHIPTGWLEVNVLTHHVHGFITKGLRIKSEVVDCFGKGYAASFIT